MDFVGKIDKLFDKLNAHQMTHPNNFKNVYRGTEEEIKFLNEMVDMFANIKLLDKTNIELTHKCEVICNKKESLIETFNKRFELYSFDDISVEEKNKFLQELKQFLNEFRVANYNKSRNYITENVNLSFNDLPLLNALEKIFEEDSEISIFGQLSYMMENIKIFKKDKDCTNSVHFLNGWITTIKGTMLLFENLKMYGYKFLKTRRINQDSLENFFGFIRRRNGNCTHPSCWQFATTYNQLAVIEIMDNHGTLGNCEEDNDITLITDLVDLGNSETGVGPIPLPPLNEKVVYCYADIADIVDEEWLSEKDFIQHTKDDIPLEEVDEYLDSVVQEKIIDDNADNDFNQFPSEQINVLSYVAAFIYKKNN